MAASGASVAALRRLVPLVVVLVLLAPARGDDDNNNTELAAAAGGGGGTARPRQCAYTVKIKTSCASPRRTSDAVSLAFGDTYRNEAYARRLPSSSGRALERCGTDTFRMGGPCGYVVCYLNLRRSGRDGWVPEWVQVVQPGRPPVATTFYFGNPLPDGVWYGHNRCPKASAAAAGEPSAVVDAGNSSAFSP